MYYCAELWLWCDSSFVCWISGWSGLLDCYECLCIVVLVVSLFHCFGVVWCCLFVFCLEWLRFAFGLA